jgi:hypothetical protein
VKSIYNGMINFLYYPVFKLHAEMTVGIRVLGENDHTRGILVKPVAGLRVRIYVASHAEQIERVISVFQCGDKWWFVQSKVILILPEYHLT